MRSGGAGTCRCRGQGLLRRTPVPAPRLHRDESRQGGQRGSQQPEGPGKGETGSGKGERGSGKGETGPRKGRRGEGSSTPTPPRHFAPGWGEALPSPGDVNFFLQSRGKRFNFKAENKTRSFFPAGTGREWDEEVGEHPVGGFSRPPGCGGHRDAGGTASRRACVCSSEEFGVR